MFVEVLLLIVIFILLFLALKEDKNYPPGPWGLPFLGRMMPAFPEDAKKMAQKYGKLFMVKTGAVRVVYIADFEMIKEAFSMPEFSDRPKWRILASLKNGEMNKHYLGVINTNGERWLHNRRFSLKNLKDLGMGKSRLETAINIEVEDLVKKFANMADGQPVELPFDINITVLNVIFQLVASRRYSLDDEFVRVIMKKINDVQDSVTLEMLPDFFPFTQKILPKSIFDRVMGYKNMKSIFVDFYNDMMPFIEEHKKTLDLNNPRDLLDDYLIGMENEDKSTQAEKHFELPDLLRLIFDFFVAGNDTTASTIKWIILYLTKFQNVQKRVQDEIDKVVARDRLPGLEHRHSLAIVDAVINEALRMSTFAPFGVFHAANVDTTFKGYFIPKDTVLIGMAAYSHEDPQYWENPKEFNPDRFLDSSGKLHMNKQGFQAFSIGRRQCLGEALARMELYLFTSALMHKFNFSPPPGEEINTAPKKIPFVNFPPIQKVVIRKRS